MKDISILCASLMAGPGVKNGFTDAVEAEFTGGYYTLHPGNKQFNSELIRMVDTHKPTIVFLQIQQQGIILEEVAKYISQKAFVINFSGDIRRQTEGWYYEIGKLIQLTCFSNMRDVINLKNLGCNSKFLEIGVDEEIYKPYDVPKMHDIVFHGNDYGDQFPLGQYRRDIVTALKKEFGQDFAVFGNFPGAQGDFNSSQIEEAKNYCRAKIAINCSNFKEASYTSDRMLRIMSTAVPMCLSHNFPGLQDRFRPGYNMAMFDDIPELIETCYHYLREYKDIPLLAGRGRELMLEKYTFKKMAENIKKLYLNYEQ